MTRRDPGTTGRVLLVIVVSVLAAVAGNWAAWHTRETTREVSTTGIPVPVTLVEAGTPPKPAVAASGPMPSPAGIARAIAKGLGSAALGPQPLVRIVDASTGAVLFDQGGATAAAPASTGKLLTAAAILTVHPASFRFTTTVRLVGSSVYLIGGGDPTLTAAAAGQKIPYSGAAKLSSLAAALRAAGVRATKIVVDDSLFAGPAVSPDWAPEDVPSSYGSAITALMTDGGRNAPGDYIRSTAPDLAAGHELADALGVSGVSVTRGKTPATARLVGHVNSAPLSTLVDQMLHESDNVIAEVLARQVAVAKHAPATFVGGATAIRSVLLTLGIDVGTGMRDGSGLAAADRVSPASLVAVLRLAAGYPPTSTKKNSTPPATQANALISALPVGGWSGTLAHRYIYLPSSSAAGDVRAKTGSIDGITTLAGYLHIRSGRLLVFSFDADHTPSGGTYYAEQALDRVIATLAACGCA